ncbi:methionyl-tRNA formyltransferase [Pseudogulbenkiania sp. NH8B]|nr:methionyl-tRNA formyltransferase [Pseudogulbenkiania sp. NH8B]
MAIKMIEELDAGPVYLREPISLLGGGEEIVLRIYQAIAKLIDKMSVQLPEPIPQNGEIYSFKRRTPADSALPTSAEIKYLFDKIRILDIENYPPAYIEYGDFRLEFTRPSLRFSDEIEATVKIKKIKGT